MNNNINYKKVDKSIIDELEKEFFMNSFQIDDLTYKIKILKANKIKSRLAYITGLTLTFSVVGFILCNVTSMPFNIYVILGLLGTSITLEGIKFLGEGTGKRLREFSDSRTENEKDQEQSMYEYKKTELLSRNKNILNILDGVDFSKKITTDIESKIDNNVTESLNENTEDIEDYIKEVVYDTEKINTEEKGYQKVKKRTP